MKKMIIRGTGLASLAVAIALSAPALAQDTSSNHAQDTSANSADDVIVIGQQQQKQVVSDGALGALGSVDAMSTPFNVSSYTARLILDQQSETIADVVKNDPAVRATYGFGNSSEQFVIRGFPLSGDDVAMEGLYGVAPRQIVSPELYDRVQVLNGASAFLFGAAPGGSGIGGGINLIPKRAVNDPFVRATATYTGQSIFGGSIDAGMRFGPDHDLGVRINGVYRDGEAASDHEHRSATVGGASLDWRHGAGRVTLDLGYERQEVIWGRPTVTVASPTVPVAPAANYNYGQPWTFTRLRDIYGIFRAELDVAKNVTLFTTFGFRDGREDGEYSAITLSNATTGAGYAYSLLVPREDNNYAGQVGVRAAFNTGGISHKFNAGASVTLTDNRNAYVFGSFGGNFYYDTNIYHTPSVAAPAASFSGGDVNNLKSVKKTDMESVYASDTLGFFDDHVLVIAGLRRQAMLVNAFDYSGVPTTTYRKTATTPVVGIVVKPTSYLSLYANRIEGLSQGPTAPSGAVNQGAVFAPYKSTQYEAGVKLGLARFTATAAIYQIEQPSAYLNTANTFVVDGLQRNRGFEFSINGEASRYVRFIGGLSVNDAKLTKTQGGLSDGKTAIGVPKVQVNFGMEVVPPFLDKLTVTGRVVYTDRQQVDVANTLQIPSWTTFDLGARYIIVTGAHPITLRASVDNITNKNYWASSFGGYLLQGAARTLRVSATVEF
ncbi:MAG: hypothetical protein JWR80_9903 [Bradyrhizobium sp.]|nr:hypothetical protein [Bradyrhizobium sp.]